ncbi:unnamed protein product [Closterium sp. NIES-54]
MKSFAAVTRTLSTFEAAGCTNRIRTVRLQFRERFSTDLPVLCLHSDRGGEFPSILLRDFCRGEGILKSFTLPASPQQNGIAEHRIGLVMEVAHTSMIHAAAPHFLWPFAVWYAAHQLNLLPRVSLPETSPTLRWTGQVGDASVFRIWSSRPFVRDTSVDKLSAHAIPCIFLGFVPNAPGLQLYHPTSHRDFPFHDVKFDELVPFYRLFPYRSAPPPPPPLFLAPGPPPVEPLPPQGPSPSDVSQVDPLLGIVPVEVARDSGAARGAASGGAASGGEEPGGADPGGAKSEGAGSGGAEHGGAGPGGAERADVGPGGAESEGAESVGAEPRVAASSGGPSCVSSRLSPQLLREWLVRRARLWSGGTRAGGAGATGAGGAGVTTRAGGTGGIAATGPRGARTRDTGAAGTGCVGDAGARDPTELGAAGGGGAGAGGTGAGGTGAGGAGVGGTGAGGAGAGEVGPGDTVRPRPYFVPLLQQVLGVPSSTNLTPPLLSSCRVWPVCTAHGIPRSRPSPVPDTHAMALRPSSPPLSVPLLAPPESSLCAVTDPSFETAAAPALVGELLDFAAACRLDYANAFVAESASPPSVGGECALCTDVLEDRYRDIECLATAVPRLASMMLAPEGDSDAPDILTPRSYAEAITGEAAAGFVACLQGALSCSRLQFAPSTADPSLFLRTYTSLPPFYVLVYVDDLVFATADTEALTLVKSELQKRHICTDLGELRSYLGLQITRDRARRTITLTESHMVHQVLQRFGFQFSLPQPTPLSTGHSLSAPPSDECVEPSGPYPELVGCLMYLMTCTRPDLAYPLSLLAWYAAPGRHRKVLWDAAKRVLRYLCSTSGMGLVLGGRGPVVLTGHEDASWVDDSAMQWSSQGYTFSHGTGSVSWRSTRSSLVLSSSCEAQIYAGAMAAQELCWLTYLLTDLGEQPHLPSVLCHTGGGAANKTAEGYGAAGGSRGRGGGRGQGRGRGFGRGRGRGLGLQGEGAQGKASPGMFLMVEDVIGSEGDVGLVGKVVMHPLTHSVIDSGCTSHMTPRADLLDEVNPPGKIKFVAAASGALLHVMGVGNAKVMGANGELVGLGNVLLVDGLSANLLSVRRLQKSKAKVMFGPTSCRAKLGKLLLWGLEEKSSCIMDLCQLRIIPWNRKPPAMTAGAAKSKAAAGKEETAPTDGALDAVNKVQQPQQPHGEVLAGVDAIAAWA